MGTPPGGLLADQQVIGWERIGQVAVTFGYGAALQ
jgi:hypothetical protein